MNFKSRIKRAYKEMIFRMSAGNSFIFLSFYRYFYRPKKGSIDEFTDKYSRSRKKITVVQVGANDGINNDPIHKFIKRDRWQGVLLEPQKYVFEKYLRPLYAGTPGIIPLNAALDIKDGYKPVYKVAVSNSRWATGLTSFNRSVLEEAVRSGYIERQALKEGAALPTDREDYIVEEKAECISASTLIEKYNLTKIDWLQIDTEGFDYEIIKMFNIAETCPEVIVYENLHLPPAIRDECTEHLGNNGYFVRNIGPNTLAMKKPAEGFRDFFI